MHERGLPRLDRPSCDGRAGPRPAKSPPTLSSRQCELVSGRYLSRRWVPCRKAPSGAPGSRRACCIFECGCAACSRHQQAAVRRVERDGCGLGEGPNSGSLLVIHGGVIVRIVVTVISAHRERCWPSPNQTSEGTALSIEDLHPSPVPAFWFHVQTYTSTSVPRPHRFDTGSDLRFVPGPPSWEEPSRCISAPGDLVISHVHVALVIHGEAQGESSSWCRCPGGPTAQKRPIVAKLRTCG